MNNIKRWLLASTVRAVKTGAQAAVGIIGAAAVMGEVDWALVISGAALSMVVSYLTSIAGIPEVDGGVSLPVMVHVGEEGEDA